METQAVRAQRVAMLINRLRLPCAAPRAPDGCEGEPQARHTAHGPVPICEGHREKWENHKEWSRACAQVAEATALTSDLAMMLAIQDGGTIPKEERAPWINWDDVRAGKIPHPGFNAEGRRPSKSSKYPRKTDETQPGAAVKNRKWAAMPWWLKKKILSKGK